MPPPGAGASSGPHGAPEEVPSPAAPPAKPAAGSDQVAPPATPAEVVEPAAVDTPEGPAAFAALGDAKAQPAERRGEQDSSSASEAAAEDVGPAKEEEEGREEGEGDAKSDESDIDYAAVLDRMRWLMSSEAPATPDQVREPVMQSFDLAGVAELIKSGKVRRIVCMCGAGISVSAGIPDFRSPGSGLYHRLEKYDLPYPQAVFEIDFFRTNPRPFFLLAKELFPGNFNPTPTHYFMRLLHDKGLLLRCFTQNIDSLEHQAGLPKSAVVAAHGNFDSAHCIRCGRPHSVEHVRQAVFAGEGNPCYCTHKGCGGLVKPDIVFFGENLPERFWQCVPQDLPKADLLIVMGTSLVVQPFASLIDRVGRDTPRLLINRERAGEADPLLAFLGQGFNFNEGNYRDALYEGDCDAGVRELSRLLGWEEELDALIAAGPPAGQKH